MDGASSDYRSEVFERLEGIPTTRSGVRVITPDIEEQLSEVLDNIYAHLRDDIGIAKPR